MPDAPKLVLGPATALCRALTLDQVLISIGLMVDVALPLKPHDARRLIDSILSTGTVLLSDPHGVREMEKDDLDMGDALNVLRAGIVRDPEWENGEWRYHVETPRMTFVIAFESDTTLMIVTAWRKKP